ncbi:MAG TPA: anion transporter [Methanoregulaceae archaeon]|nr:anion transporter [Methanoregulaceae archaeon]
MPLVPPLAVLLVVAALLAVRRVRGRTLPAWAVALAGALLVVATGGITPAGAVAGVDWGVLATLASLFVVGTGLGRSRLADEALARLDRLPLSIPVLGALLGGIAVFAALVTNDAVAVVGAPFLVRLARRRGLSPEPLLLLLMAGVTTGAVPSPLGSPQNLLIAASPELGSPFTTFLFYLGPPTLAGLAAVLILLRLVYPGLFRASPSAEPAALPVSGDPRRDLPVLLSLLVLGSLVLAGIAAGLGGGLSPLPPLAVALAAATPLLLLGPDRRELAAGIDWRTLLLFVGLFVMTAGVRGSGLVEASFGAATGSTAVLMAAAVIGSQVVSNVPLVAIALPFVEPHGVTALMALAAGSTIAGHLTLLGAVSNLIVVESEGRLGATVRTRAFTGIGLVLVLVQGLCYWAWLTLVG